MANKRERCTNWEKEEKQLLREMVKSYLPIIENKNLNTNTNKAKLAAWIEITEKFNTMNSITRNRKQLVNQWKVTKLNTKKILSKHQHDILKTGGGPKPPSPSPETLELVDLLPLEFVVDSNEFDCDGIQYCLPQDKENKENVDENLKNIKALASPSEQPPITPKITEKKIPMANKKTKFNFAEASYNDMHEFRIMENERLQKEHELRINHMEEMHAHVLKNKKLEKEMLVKSLETLNK